MSAAEYPEIDFKLLKEWLFATDRKKLRDEFSCTRQTVTAVCTGKTRNMRMLRRAFELASDNKQGVVSSQERLKRL